MTRFFDIVFSLAGIIILSPLFLLVAVIIAIESRGGVFYSQLRVGRLNKDFKLYKFRSMLVGSDKKGLLTVGKDNRITKVGTFIRKYKIDELPQLYNVLCGDMSLVGPRPEVRKYVKLYSKEQAIVLDVRPGITDFASIAYINENALLANSDNPEQTYIDTIMPEKLRLNMQYLQKTNTGNYFKIIFLTLRSLVKRA